MSRINIGFAFLTLILIQSCTYHRLTPVSLEQAVDRGSVKVVTPTGNEVFFDAILYDNGQYIGKSQVSDLRDEYTPIDPLMQNEYFIQEEDTLIHVWVKLTGDETENIEGYLIEVKEESIIVSLSNPNKSGQIELVDTVELLALNINEVELRKSGKVAFGAMMGMGLGIVPPLLMYEVKPEYTAMYVLAITVPSTIAGAVAGARRKSYEINGSLEQFAAFREVWGPQSVIKQETVQ